MAPIVVEKKPTTLPADEQAPPGVAGAAPLASTPKRSHAGRQVATSTKTPIAISA